MGISVVEFDSPRVFFKDSITASSYEPDFWDCTCGFNEQKVGIGSNRKELNHQVFWFEPINMMGLPPQKQRNLTGTIQGHGVDLPTRHVVEV